MPSSSSSESEPDRSPSPARLPFNSWSIDHAVGYSRPEMTMSTYSSDLPIHSWSIDPDVPNSPPSPSASYLIPFSELDAYFSDVEPKQRATHVEPASLTSELPIHSWSIDPAVPNHPPAPSASFFVPFSELDAPFSTPEPKRVTMDVGVPSKISELPIHSWSMDPDVPNCPPSPSASFFVPFSELEAEFSNPAPRQLATDDASASLASESPVPFETVQRYATITRAIPSMVALIIGINQYKSNNLSSLRGAVSDAQAIKSYLTQDLYVPEQSIRMLLDEKATRKGIIDALVTLREDPRIQYRDPILIYYAGYCSEIPTPHGWVTESKKNVISSIFPQDFDGIDIHGIPNRTFVWLIEEITREKGDNVTVILDCAHSGSFGGSSYVLLAACSAKEYARESGDRGMFTRSLVDALRAVSPDQITYVQLLGRLQNITQQNPQLVGNNKHRIVFSLRDTMRVHIPYTLRLDNSGQYILDAGSVDGVCPDAEFTIYANHGGVPKMPNLGVMVPVEVRTLQTVMRPLSLPGPSVDKAASAFQTQAGALEELKVFIPLDLIPAFKTMLIQKKTLSHDRHRIMLVDDRSTADLVVLRVNDKIAFVILDKRVTAHGITKYALNTDLDNMVDALLLAARYRYHLNRSYLTSGDIEKGIKVESFKLGQFDEDTLRRPSGENLLKDGIITLSLSNDVDDVGIRITNTSTRDLYPSIFYFDNSELSITQLFGSGGPSQFKVDSPLPKNGSTLSLDVKFHSQDMSVGFIKCFLPTSPVDLSRITTSSVSGITTLSVTLSVDPSQAATPVHLPKFTFNSLSKLTGGPNFFRMPDAWGCVVIPVLKRRVTSYEEPGQLGSSIELRGESPMVSHHFCHKTR